MSGSQCLTGLVGLAYVVVAVIHADAGRTGLALAFLGYALANIGLILAENT